MMKNKKTKKIFEKSPTKFFGSLIMSNFKNKGSKKHLLFSENSENLNNLCKRFHKLLEYSEYLVM